MEIKLRLRFENGELKEQWFVLPLTIGKADSNELIIKSWRIAKHHVTLFYKNKKLYLEDLGSITGTLINQQRVSHLNLLNLNDQFIIGPCLIEVLQYQEKNNEINNIEQKKPISLVDYQATDEAQQSNKSNFNEWETNQLVTQYVEPINGKEQQVLTHMQQRLHFQLLEELDLRRNNVSMLDDETLRKQVKEHILKIIDTHKEFQNLKHKDELIQRVLDEAVGLGPLETLLKDQSISEIMVNRHDEIYVERFGQLALYPLSFSSEQAVNSVIDRIVAPLGRRIDESSPMVDARLKDGSRVNAIIPPVALKGTSLTIRKFPQQRPDMNQLVSLGSLDNAMSKFLDFSVKARCNLIVSGGTGSGKTTLLNVLSNCIPSQERIITIEDAAELKLNHGHLVSLESRPANAEGAGAVSIRDLVKNALRMRPDRIVVGECRGGEAFDMLAAMNTGNRSATAFN